MLHTCVCVQQPSSSLLCVFHDVQVCHVDSGVRVDHPDLVANVLKGWNLVPPGQVRWGMGAREWTGVCVAPASSCELLCLLLSPHCCSHAHTLHAPSLQVDGTPPPRAGTPDYFNYNDTYGHGTHTAGIIAGVGNNRQGIAGVNWSVKLLVCRFIWNDGSGYVSDAMNCIKLCKQEGALITSNSWGGIGYSSA